MYPPDSTVGRRFAYTFDVRCGWFVYGARAGATRPEQSCTTTRLALATADCGQWHFRMDFDPNAYGPDVAALLAADGEGRKLMPLVFAEPGPDEVLQKLRGSSAAALFPKARAPEAALSGLWFYLSCFDESHSVAQDLPTTEGSYWHAILHRREPDPGNAGYWFRRVGRHVIFPALAEAACAIGTYPVRDSWDPFAFIDFCERARQRPGSPEEQAARRIQLVEWQLLFDYCARPA